MTNSELRALAVARGVSELETVVQSLCVWGKFQDDAGEATNALNEKLDEVPASMHNAITIVGHNLQSFDIRFLWQRYVVNGIRPHAIISAAVHAKSYDSRVFDTMTHFAGWGNRISLDKLCLALSIPSPKGDMDGSMVGKYVADGRIAEVAAYCKKDVIATREAYKRMTFQT